MRVLALLSSVVLASARRIVLEKNNLALDAAAAAHNASLAGPYSIQPLPKADAFIDQAHPMLFPQLTAKPGKKLVLNVREKARHSRVNDAVWEVLSDGGEPLEKPVRLGKCYASGSGSSLQFKTKKDRPALFKIKQWKRLAKRPVFHVVSPDDAEVYYSIRKRNGTRQTLHVYFGRCTKDCETQTPVYVAHGRKSSSWSFHRPDATGASYVDAPGARTMVARMQRSAKKFSGDAYDVVRYDETFEVEIVDPTADVGLILAAVTMADVHQDSREKGEYEAASTVKTFSTSSYRRSADRSRRTR